MSTQNQLSISIPDETIAAVLTNLQECKNLLEPYLRALTPDERHSILKMGDKSVATVIKTREYVVTNPQFVPSYMNAVEFVADATVVSQLTPITNLATQLSRNVEDTMMLAGGEAFQEALLYYGQIKEAASKGVPSAGPIYDDLKQRFAKKPRQEPTT
ncbi:hypothetical protein SAMN05443549_1011083 [Flavobacterium fluvii]|uniref:Uncharacterized protein n=1 Tax=Flavobacterium fluvii TaxID=468056 RepID=A0A1M5G4U3_9FLAO|nr:hypothetical protein [Flavobacterium fluvii]SHF98481.1 hypothetical protein SAMN05443549_1011083 [Flavobacterium fluvii]